MGIKTNFEAASAAMEAKFRRRVQRLSAATLNNQAFAARDAVRKEISTVFANPKPITRNSVLVKKADAGQAIGEQRAMIYIRDDVLGASTQPDKYLLTEDSGGARANKRFETVLKNAGFIMAGQQVTPGKGLVRDGFGQPSGSAITQVLSRVKAFGEMGFTANANSKTTEKLRRAARAKAAKSARQAGGDKAAIAAAKAGAFAPIVARTGNDFFMMRSRLQEGFAGVFQLIGKGKVQPVLWFDIRQPRYKARFAFRSIVGKAARENFAAATKKALAFVRGID